MATTPHGSSAEQVAEALQFVVQHGASNIDQQTLCRLLQTHSVIRRALQACRSQCAVTLRLIEADVASVRYNSNSNTSNTTDIIVVAPLSKAEEGTEVPADADPPAEAVAASGRQRLVWFARWMCRHAGLVSRCTVHMPNVHTSAAVLIRLQLALAKVLQDCAPPPPAAAAAAALGVTNSSAGSSGAATQVEGGARAGVRVGLPLQLQSFVFTHLTQLPEQGIFVVSRLLRALAAVNLQELDAGRLCVVNPGFIVGLRALQSLRSLRLEGCDFDSLPVFSDSLTNVHPIYKEALVSAVGSLRHLTSLHFDATVSMLMPEDGKLLPASLRVLEGVFVQGAGNEDTVELSHLTALTRLRWGSAEHYVAGVKSLELALPPKLSTLIAGSPLPRVQGAQSELQQLTVQLVLPSDCDVLASLLSLATPVELSVVLGFSHNGGPYSFAVKLSKPALERAATAVGACTSLLSFELDASQCCDDADSGDDGEELYDDVRSVRWCAALAKLPALRRLIITGLRDSPYASFPMRRSNIVCLTALTSLTELGLMLGRGSGLGASAEGLCTHLSKLRHLHLECKSINSWTLLPALIHSTGLQSLYVSGGRQCAVTDRQLLLLSFLKRLKSLTLVGHECSDAAQATLLAAVPGLSRIEHQPHLHENTEYFD